MNKKIKKLDVLYDNDSHKNYSNVQIDKLFDCIPRVSWRPGVDWTALNVPLAVAEGGPALRHLSSIYI